MILSLIDYGNIFLTILTQEDKSDLQKLQNKVLRFCLDIVDPLDMDIIEMHNLVNVDLVEERRTYNLLTLTHRRVKADKLKCFTTRQTQDIMMAIQLNLYALEMNRFGNRVTILAHLSGKPLTKKPGNLKQLNLKQKLEIK